MAQRFGTRRSTFGWAGAAST